MDAPIIKVLLIDDEPNLLDVSKQFLEIDGCFSIDTAISAKDALKLIEKQDFDVVISDYQMPEMDGIQLLKEIRAKENYVPFILFTGRGREEIVIEALNNGADFYLQKGGAAFPQFAELANMIKQAHSKKEGEKSLKKVEEKYYSLFMNSVDAIIITDSQGKIISANPAACRYFKMTEEEIKKVTHWDIVIDDRNWKDVQKNLETESVAKGELTFKTKEGASFIGEVTSCIWNDLNKKTFVSMIIRAVQSGSEKSEIKYQMLFDSAQEGLLIIDYKTNLIIDVNSYLLDMIGFTIDEVVNRSVWELGFIENKSLTEDAFLKLKANGSVRYENLPLKGKNGEIIYTEFVSHVLVADQEVLIQCTIKDTRERHRMVQKIIDLTRIIDSSDDAIIGMDLNGKIFSWSNGSEKIFGYTEEEVIGQTIFTVLSPDSIDDVRNLIIKTKKEMKSDHLDIKIVSKNGNMVDLIITMSPIMDEKRHITGTSIIGKDNTEGKRLNVALRESIKKINLLSHITRHDIKNQILILEGKLTLLDKNHLNNSFDDNLKAAESAAKHISDMIQFTREYENIGMEIPYWQNINLLLEKSFDNVNLKQIEIINDVSADIELFADPLIVKVFYNLIQDSVKHGGNKITTIRFSIEEQDGGFAFICEDNGLGISAEKKRRLFTYNLEKAHGFGLFLSREILEITGITLSEEGELGKGAKFVMTVPPGGLRKKQKDYAE
jgi:PAS domain S-box-containing protein